MKYTNHFKRFFALMLCLCMVLGMVPAAARAAEETGYAVEINGTVTTYTDFREALYAACEAEAATLKLYQDVPEGFHNTFGGNVTLDLNGKTVGSRIGVDNCTLTVTDTAEAKGTVTGYAGAAFDYYSGKLIILDTVDCTGEAEGHEPWRISRTYETAADAGTIGTTGTEDIVIPEGVLALYINYNTVETFLPEAGYGIYLHIHDWADVNCTDPKTCTGCGATEGEALGHSFGDDGLCTVCGVSEKPLTINMYDVYGDGWTRNGIKIYMGGEYVTTVTLKDGEAGVWTGDYFPSKEYEFRWAVGSYADECSFEILFGDEQVFAASTNDCKGYDDDYRFYPVCAHNYNVIASGDRTCTIDGYTCYECTECGHSYWEYDYATGHSFSEDGICSVCSYEAESLLTIKMYDSEGDGWNGNKIVIFDLQLGAVNVTLEDGEAGVWIREFDPEVIHKIYWVDGNYPEECAFEILIDDEQVFKAEFGDCTAYHDNFQFYPVCEHSLSKLTETPPTCTEKGYTVFQCRLCGNRFTEESAALGHDYGEDGICTACGADKNTIIINMYDSGYDGWNGNAIDIYVNGEYVDYATFDDGESAVWTGEYDPSAEYEFYWRQGSWSEECSFTITICDEVVFTATEDDCAEFDDTYRFYPVCEHNYTAVRVQPPTCTEDGYTVYACDSCNHSYEDDYVATTGHSFGEDGICTACGERKFIVVFFRNDLMWTDVRVQYAGSSFVEDTTGSGEPMEFYFNDGTYDFYVAEIPSDTQTLHFTGVLNDALQTSPDENYYEWWDGCAFYVDGDSLWYGRLDYITECDHKYNRNPDEADCNHDWRCSVCYDTLKAAGHKLDSDGICTACGIDSNNAIIFDMEDSYGDGWGENAIDVYADREYIVTATLYYGETGNWMVEYDPEKEYEFYWVQGTWSEECSFTVTICGEEVFTATEDDCLRFADGYRFYPECEHEYEVSEVTPPTCTAQGYTTYSCTACGETYTDDYVAPLGHSKGEQEGVVTAPTCTAQGYTTYSCTVCGVAIYDNFVPLLGHTLGEDGSCTTCGALFSVPVWVAGEQITVENMEDVLGDGTVSYDLQTNTLTLNGFTCDYEYEALLSEVPLNIVIEGENHITSGYEAFFFDIVSGTINISGTGSVTTDTGEEGIAVNAYNDAKLIIGGSVTINMINTGYYEGINMEADTAQLVIKDSVVLIIGTDDDPIDEECIYVDGYTSGSVTISDNADITLVNTDEEGIYVDGEERSITITGGDIYINVDEEGLEANTITISGGSVETYGGSGYEGIYAINLTITGGNIIAGGDWYGVAAESFTMTGGTLEVTEGGLCVYTWSDEDEKYYPGTVTLTGVEITDPEGATIGIPESGDAYNTVLDADGNFVEAFTISPVAGGKNGIVAENGSLYYYVDGKLHAAGLIEIEGDYYYVRTNGEVVNNRSYWITNTNGLMEQGTYEFDADGKLIVPEPDPVKDGIYYENGAWYYYENGKIAYNKGLMTVTENWVNGDSVQSKTGIIYVRSNGKLATGDYYITNVSNYTGSDWKSGDKLEFDDNGLMIVHKNGIVAENGSLYYYVDDQKQYNAGVIQLDGNYYYVRSNAEVVNNRSYWITNVGDSGMIAKQYTFDANGVMQNPEFVAEVKEGIVDGYYYVNGKIAYGAGVVYLADEGCYIYVRSNGKLATGNYWPTTTNGLLDAKSYNWGTDGKLFLN